LLTASVPRDVIDDAVAAHGRQAKRSDGKCPPHVMFYFAMALALYADDDYEQVMAQLTEKLAALRCWDSAWQDPTSGGITQARKRLGAEVLGEVYDRVAEPVAEELTRGAWLNGRRLMAIDGFTWEMPDTKANDGHFGYAGSQDAAFPQARVVTLSECASHVTVGAAIGPVTGKASGEQSLARALWPRLEPDWLLIADRNFYSFSAWCEAAGTGADLLWRVKANLTLPVLDKHPDGSYSSLVINPRVTGAARTRLIETACRGEEVDPLKARRVRVVEYDVPDRTDSELICLITTITEPVQATAPDLAWAYSERWEHETLNAQIKTALRGPGRILRSRSPDMVEQEIYGYLLTHRALASLICQAATEADIDPDRVKFTRTVRIVRRRVTDTAAFPP
jgi:hypothetical protein